MTTYRPFCAAAFLLFSLTDSQGQPMTLAQVQATGAKALAPAEVMAVVAGTKTTFHLVNGSTRIWTNALDGKFIANRDRGGTARGTWSVNDDGAYCLTFDWGRLDTEKWCRQLYRVDDRYYAYELGVDPQETSGTYRFSR
jgi:hypothetical protein